MNIKKYGIWNGEANQWLLDEDGCRVEFYSEDEAAKKLDIIFNPRKRNLIVKPI